MEHNEYPFSALVGQDEMKKALILNLVNPAIGGVLIQGERGTGKSTAVRSLAQLMGERPAKACPFGCDPEDPLYWCSECRSQDLPIEKRKMKVVNLPISATLDRLVGSMDLESALVEGKKRFDPGILAMAHRNILYVDEVNLLEDHLVDVLLDAAALGENTVEREGISYSHPSRFILVGTMNPEEGDLRPQLLDRFGLVVEVVGEKKPQLRKEIMARRLDFEADPRSFMEKYRSQQEQLKLSIDKAKTLLPKVSYSDKDLDQIADFVTKLQVDGHRADLSLLKTALTHAALEGREQLEAVDLYYASGLALPHRLYRDPFDETNFDFEEFRRESFLHEI